MTAQHTPGPHHVRTSTRLAGGLPADGPMYVHDVVTADDATVCMIDAVDGRGEADARLHAAAPLMLEALRALTALPPSALLTVLKEAQRDVDDIVDQARSAIRAATGEDA